MRTRKMLVGAAAVLFVLGLIGHQFSFAQDKAGVTLNGIGGSKGGVGMVVMEAMAKIVTSAFPGITINVVPGGWVENITKIEGGLDIASTTVGMCALAVEQKPPYNTPLPSVRALYSTQDKIYCFAFAKKNLPLEYVSDLVKKKQPLKIFSLVKGNAAELIWSNVLQALGEKPEDLATKLVYGTWKEGVEKVKVGEVDVMLVVGVRKIDWAEELCKSAEMKILKWDKDLLDMTKQKIGLDRGVIPMGTYLGTDYDVIAPVDSGEIIVNAKVSADVAYSIVKALAEKEADYAKAHAGLADFKASGMANNLKFPLHDGAAKYYKEKGYIK